MAKIPDIKPGDLVKVYTKIREGDKERVTPFQGIVIKMRGSNQSKTFTVRKISAGVGVERIFPLNSPMLKKVEIKKKGKVRKAKLTYLRHRKGKKIKVKDVGQISKKPDEEIGEKPPEPTKEKPAHKEQKIEKPEEQPVEGAPGQKAVEKT